MGMEILKSSVIYGKRLSGNAYKVLVVMSLSALDKPSNGRPASLYWGGWDALAVALGHDSADRNGTGHNAVARAIRELKSGRHITPMVDAGRGTRQSYLVHPGGLNVASQGGQDAHAKGEQSAPTKGEHFAPQRVSKMLPPRNTKDSGDLSQDISIASETKPQSAREAEKPAEETVRGHKFNGTPPDDCTACGKGYLNRTAHPMRLLMGA